MEKEATDIMDNLPDSSLTRRVDFLAMIIDLIAAVLLRSSITTSLDSFTFGPPRTQDEAAPISNQPMEHLIGRISTTRCAS